MGICNDKYYVGVPELQRRVDTERRLTMERSSLELRVRDWSSSSKTSGDTYQRLTGDVQRHNDAIRAYNRSVSEFRPGCRR